MKETSVIGFNKMCIGIHAGAFLYYGYAGLSGFQTYAMNAFSRERDQDIGGRKVQFEQRALIGAPNDEVRRKTSYARNERAEAYAIFIIEMNNPERFQTENFTAWKRSCYDCLDGFAALQSGFFRARIKAKRRMETDG